MVAGGSGSSSDAIRDGPHPMGTDAVRAEDMIDFLNEWAVQTEFVYNSICW